MYITATALVAIGIWKPDFNAMVAAVDGKIRIQAYLGTTQVNGVIWTYISGFIKF